MNPYDMNYSIAMKTLNSNMSREIKRTFDAHLAKEDDLQIFKYYDEFMDYYWEFVRINHFCGEIVIEMDLFQYKYGFDWFDVFKIIKIFHDGQESFEDYDDEVKSWEAFCNICAWNATFIESDEYKKYYSGDVKDL